MVTVLAFSSASSSSFAFRASVKNLKMDSKLIQEVSSCLSVPADEDTQTRRCLLTVTQQANNSKQDILTTRHLMLESVQDKPK